MGMKNWRFLTNISLYFEKGTRSGYYNGRRTGTRISNGAISNDLNDPWPRFQGHNILNVT